MSDLLELNDRMNFAERYLHEIDMRLHYAGVPQLTPEQKDLHGFANHSRGLPRKPGLEPLRQMGVNEIEAPRRGSHHIDPTTGEAVQT